MKFLSVRELRGNSATVWRELSKEREMVVTSNGRPVAVLTPVDERNLEESLNAWRRVRAAQAITRIQSCSPKNQTDKLSMDDINAEIRKVRRERRKKR